MFKQRKYLKQHTRKAQGMVEFALALPVFLLLVFGVIEFGRLLLSFSAVYTASREAARFGAAVGDSGAGVPYFQDCTGIRQAAVRVGAFAGVTEANVVIKYFRGVDEPTPFATFTHTSPVCNVTIQLGYLVAVEITSSYQPIIPIVNLPQFPITSAASRTIVQGIDVMGTPGFTSTSRPSSNTATLTPTPTNTVTPSSTITLTPSITPSLTPSNTPITPTTTDNAMQTVIAQTLIANHMTATSAVATANMFGTQQAQTQTAFAFQTQTAQAIQETFTAQTATSISITRTAAADCTWIVTGFGASPPSQPYYDFQISNTSSASGPRNASIQSIEINWNASDSLHSVAFWSSTMSTIWTGNVGGPNTTLINTFAPGADLTLNQGVSKTMRIIFSGSNPKVIFVRVQFNNSPCPAVSAK